jgi:predicted short-subunit dehydrogenase-like oxidoreductase (DUF2520 family)
MVEPRPRIGFVGAGRAGTVLALALSNSGYQVVAIASRRLESAESLADRLPSARAFADLQEVITAADLIFLTVPDGAIAEVASRLAWRVGVAVIHTSGALSRDVLAPAAAQGAATGSLHPLQTFAGLDQALLNLPGSVFAVEASGELRETLLRVVADLGGTAIELSAEDKILYHAAAVFASNYIVTLTALAADLLAHLGVGRDDALRALLPLVRGAVNNLETLGLPGALTGPISRGDVDTVRRHLVALADMMPGALPAYRELGVATIALAIEQGLPESAQSELCELLSPTLPA